MNEKDKLSREARQVTRAAALMSVGNIASRALGLVREMTKSSFFGAGGAVSAFDVASQVPTMFYDQLAGGMLNAALVPVFSDYAAPEERADLQRLMSQMFSSIIMVLGAVIVLVIMAAPSIARFLGPGLEGGYLTLGIEMIRITAPAIFFLNVAGLFSGALYALKRFNRPAFTPAIYNAVMVLTVVLTVVLGWRTTLGTRALAIGLLCASIAQIAFQMAGLRDVRLSWVFPWPLHPAMKTIGRLYLPIGVGLLVDQLAVALSYNIASRTGESGIAWMKYAATLIQFPLGLVVSAVSVAILPTLSRYATRANEEAFRATLAQGLRLVLVLVAPAAMILLVLAEPLVAVLLQRGEFMPGDTLATAQVLRFSLLGMIFAALDQPLIFAFYARKDTWTPALVGVITVVFYIALALIPTYLHTPRLWELTFANSLKLTAHALLMWYLFSRKVGGLGAYHVWRTVSLSLLATAVMVLPMLATLQLLPILAPGALGVLLRLILVAGIGLLVYLVTLSWLGVDDLRLLRRAIFRRAAADSE